MIQRIIITVAFSFIYLTQYGQFKVKADKDFKNYSDSLIRYANIPLPDFKNNDFEMRVWVIRYVNKPHALFIFTHSNNNKWTETSYNFCTKDWINFSGLTVDSFKLSQLWGKRWDSLMGNGILKIPTEKKVSRKWKSSNDIVTIVADGVAYRIELFTPKGKRRYSYSNPESKLSNYDLNNSELVAINNIIEILNNELKFKEKLDRECN